MVRGPLDRTTSVAPESVFKLEAPRFIQAACHLWFPVLKMVQRNVPKQCLHAAVLYLPSCLFEVTQTTLVQNVEERAELHARKIFPRSSSLGGTSSRVASQKFNCPVLIDQAGLILGPCGHVPTLT